MGVTVADEHPYAVAPLGIEARWIKHFRLRPLVDPPQGAYDRFEDMFLAVLGGEAEDDPFNRLVLRAGLSWREVALLRAYSRYIRQVGTPFSQTYIATTLAAHPDLARRLIALFGMRLDPEREIRHAGEADTTASDAVVAEITEELDSVTSLDEDRILRATTPSPARDLAYELFPDRRRRPARARASSSSSIPRACPIFPSPGRCSSCSSTRRTSKGCTSAPGEWRGVVFAGRTGARISAPRFSGS